MCMGASPACIILHIGMWYPQRPKEHAASSGTGVPDHCERPCGSWELNADPLEEQQVLLTAEPPLYPIFVNSAVASLLGTTLTTSMLLFSFVHSVFQLLSYT